MTSPTDYFKMDTYTEVIKPKQLQLSVNKKIYLHPLLTKVSMLVIL